MEPAPTESGADWWRRLQALVGVVYPRVHAWDAVNEAMIRHWCEAVGDENPIHTDPAFAAATALGTIVAPPSMLRAWLLPGYGAHRPPGSAQTDATAVRALFAEGGFGGVIGAGAHEEYARYLRPGERLSYSSVLESVSALKQTRQGAGYFYTIRMDVFDQRDEPVSLIRASELAYRPKSGQETA
jgi:acyl dehydratase